MTTKDRILDAAERLFASDGIEATSLRAITTEAGVNLAAVNYHFQSKEALVQAVIARRVGPDKPEAAGDAGCVRERRPAMGRSRSKRCWTHSCGRCSKSMRVTRSEFVPLMGRIYTEPGGIHRAGFQRHLEHVAMRFFASLPASVARFAASGIAMAAAFLDGRM